MKAGLRSRESGFTLIEMLVAMALLATLGTFLVQLLRNGFDLYRQGDQRGDHYATAIPILERLEDDLLAVQSGTDGRLVIETEVFGGGKGKGDGLFLRMVRTMPHGEREHPVLRRAGTKPGPQESYDGADPGPEARGDIEPPSGLVEVAYALMPSPEDEKDRPGILTLYRGVHAPALGPGGYFDRTSQTPFDENAARKRMQPIATDILGLWILCYGQASEEWGEADVLSGTRRANLAQVEWDSTRGLLSKDVFEYARGPQSVDDERDDVYPRRIRIVLQVGRGGRPDGLLRSTLGADQELLRIGSWRELPTEDEEDRYVKVGHEWLLLHGPLGSDIRVTRGMRRTRATLTAHGPGTPVWSGRTFRKTLALPAKRSYWTEGTK